MNIPRHTPVTLEQAVLRCEQCREVLAIVESLGDTIVSVYLWRPVRDEAGKEIPSRCHRMGVSDAQAISAYKRDGCDQYWQEQIVDYHWPDRHDSVIPELLEEPVLVEDTDEQMQLLTN